jgi:FkbM family methyltransferase
MGAGTHFAQAPSVQTARELLARIGADRPSLSPREVDAPLALYGAGNLGRMAREYFARLEIPVEFVVDANAEQVRMDPYWAGTRVFAPDEVRPEWRQRVLLAVCVVTSPYTELAAKLIEAGWIDFVPFYDIAEAYRSRHPLSNGWFAPPFSGSCIEGMETVLDAWADDISRAHHLQFIAWRRLREEWVFSEAPVTVDDRFFIPEVLAVLSDQESFADVGAHVGTVSQRFIEIAKGSFRKIWAIEADPDSISSLRSCVSRLPRSHRDKIEIIPALVGSDRSERKFFSGLGYASQCSGMGQSLLASHRIDDLQLAPSFIKLHLEGHELDALTGATGTLRRHRPIVVATSYHNDLGLWQMPSWLMQFFGRRDYKHYLRLHSWCGTGAVIYCVPDRLTRATNSDPYRQTVG